MNEHSKISTLKGIGEKTEALFEKAGVCTIGDLLRYYPRGYDVYDAPILIQDIEEGRTVTVTGAIIGRVQVDGSRNMQVTRLHIKDASGTLKVLWFRMPFLKSTLHGGIITLRGRIVKRRDGLIMEHPEIFYPSAKYNEKQDTLQPVYPLTAGLTNNAVKKSMQQAMAYLDPEQDFLPEEIRLKYQLAEYLFSVKGVHFPQNKDEFYEARERMVFDEFLVFILSLRKIKVREDKVTNGFHFQETNQINTFLNALPYELTGAQMNVWSEIKNDLSGPCVMSRLIQGDVGSGKTIVAVLGLIYAGINGYQGAMMAPTEVLAKQHYETMVSLFKNYNIPLRTVLLTGSMSVKEKREVYQLIASGEADLIVGTHALIQDKAEYKNLALVVTDEQHRFGVKQREALAGKGSTPHILVMSATPIPRTLAIILYGDLDISIIDELPKNRLPIKNCVVDTGYRDTAYRFMQKQVEEGRQCYVICPMVEESEHLEAENVMDYAQILRDTLPDKIKIAYLHGKMKQAEKDIIMESFSRNEIQILVSTTVIEVGIDVPNSTVMLIENAERFGLAQLHQLRGRVGRGAFQSYCIFMSASKSKETKQRLEILNKSNDGFFIASEDLRLRGPGDLFGIRQSGILNFKLGDVFQDSRMLKTANEAAEIILTEDPDLNLDKNQRLKTHLNRYLSESMLETTL
jgi:ATP-dependent DNA helicase RecG